MRKLVIILIVFIAVVTFVRVVDNSDPVTNMAPGTYEKALVPNF